jgi:hypothetical protein
MSFALGALMTFAMLAS